nr:hypothetical protein [uncultured Prevotella sp.]
MDGDNGQESFSIHIDNSQLENDAKKSSDLFAGIGDAAVNQGQRIDSTWKEITLKRLQDEIDKTMEKINSTISIIAENNKEVIAISSSIADLQKDLAKTDQGSAEFKTLTDKINQSNEALSATTENTRQMSAEQQVARGHLTELETQYNRLAQTAGAAGTIMDANAAQNAAAGLVEAGALTGTTAAAAAKAAAEGSAAIATNQESVASDQSTVSNEQQAQSVRELKEEYKSYQESIKEIKAELDALDNSGSISELQQKIANEKDIIGKLKAEGATQEGTDSEGAALRNALAYLDQYQQKLTQLESQHQRLTADLQEYQQVASNINTQISNGGVSSSMDSGEAAKIVAIAEAQKQVNDQFTATATSAQQAQQGISSLSQESANYTQQAESLKSEISTMSAALRLSEGQGIDSESRAAAIDAINQKIQQYGTLMTEASASANVAYQSQVTNVKALEAEMTSLQTALQNALAMGDQQGADQIVEKMRSLGVEITNAKNNLSELETQAKQSGEALKGVADEQEKMSAGSTRGSSFFGDIADSAQLLKEKVSDAFSSMTGPVSNFVENAKGKFSEIGQSISGAFSNLSNKIGLDRLGEGVSNVSGKLGEYSSKLWEAASGNGKLQESASAFKKALGGLAAPIKSTIVGIGNMTKALWSMAATPIGAVITAIVVALEAMNTWLHKSADGQKTLAKVTAYLGSLWSSVTDIVILLGRYLYHAFADAGAPMNAFARGFKTTFVQAIRTVSQLIGGLGKTLKGIFTLDWSTFQAGFSEMGNGLISAGKTAISAVKTTLLGAAGAIKTIYNGITDTKLMSGIGSIVNNMMGKASQAAALAERQTNSQIALGKAQEKGYELDKKIAEKRERIYTLTGAAKNAAIEEVKALQRERYDDIIKAQTEQLNIQKEKNRLHEVGLDDIKKERDLHIQVLQTEAQQAASTRMMTRMEESNKRSMASQAASAAKSAKTSANSQAAKSKRTDQAVTSAQGKLDETEYTNLNERVKSAADLEQKVTDARIAAMKDGAEKTKAEREQENRKELEQIESQREAAVEAERKRQKAEYDAQQEVIKARGGKAGKWNDSMINQAPIDKINTQYEQISTYTQQKQTNAQTVDEKEAMDNYLKEYGTFEQKKFAITELYNNKIQAATTQGEKLTIGKDLEKAISDLLVQQMKQNINWDGIFSNLSNMTKKELQEAQAKLKAYTQTDEYQKLRPEDKKAISEANAKIQDQLEQSSGLFGSLKITTEQYAQACREYDQALSELLAAQDELKDLQARGASNEDINAAQAKVSKAQQNVNQASNNKSNSGASLQSATNSTINKFESLAGTLANLGKTSDMTTAQLGQLVESVSQNFGKVAGKVGGIVGSIMQVLDSIGDQNIDTWVDGILKNVFNSAGNVLNSKFFGIHYINNLFGGNLFGSNYNASEIEDLTNSNKDLEEAVKTLTKAMEDTAGKEATEAYNTAKTNLEDEEKNYQKMMHDAGSAYSNGVFGIGGKSSSNHRIDEGMSTSDWQRISELVGKTVDSAGDLWDLSSEDMAKIANGDTAIWTKLKNLGDDGYKNASQYMDTYVDLYQELIDLQNQYNETVTGISFDSAKDSLTSLLKETSNGLADAKKKVKEFMVDAIIDNLENSTLKSSMQKWYTDFATDMSDGILTATEQATLTNEYSNLYSNGESLYKAAMSAAGINPDDYDQSSTTGSLSGLTQDQGDEMNGRLTAVQEGVYNLEDLNQQLIVNQSAILDGIAEVRLNMSDMMDMQSQGIDHLAKIEKYTSELPDIRADIAKIKTNTAGLNSK